jgi:NAD(P)-dependent dehydrogenase (short-subunit alcohol dehydrogenase family)
VTDIREELLENTVEKIKANHSDVEVLSLTGDISKPEFVTSFMESVSKEFGRIDYAVNCAGILSKDERSTDMSLAAFDQLNNVNYRACWMSSRAELAVMLKQEPLPSHVASRPPQRGAIVNIASQLGIVSRPLARKFSSNHIIRNDTD